MMTTGKSIKGEIKRTCSRLYALEYVLLSGKEEARWDLVP